MTTALVVPTIEYFRNRILCTDALTLLNSLPDASVHCIVTSPPYFGLRDYGADGQLGLEDTPAAFINRLVTVFREARRALRDDGTLWINLGDSYSSQGGATGDNTLGAILGQSVARKESWVGASIGRSSDRYGLPPKNLLGIPWRVALALQTDGWVLRSDIIWNKPNPMPESVTDRPTKAHEYVFLFAKSQRYFYDQDAVREPFEYAGDVRVNTAYNMALGKSATRPYKFKLETTGRNKRSVWTIATQPYSEAHFATFPPNLIEPMIKAGCPKRGIVLDPFMGSGTTALVARRLGRDYIGCDLNPEYVAMAQKRIDQEDPTKPKVYANGDKQLSLFAEVIS